MESLGLRLYWSSTHPFSLWEDQRVTPNDRYETLLNILQERARALAPPPVAVEPEPEGSPFTKSLVVRLFSAM